MSGAMTAIGLMSGLSLDGIEVALVVTDGERQVERGVSLTFPYSAELRERLREAVAAAWRLNGEGGGTASDRDLLAAVEQELTALHAEAVKFFLETNALARDAVAVLGFHGHTVCRDAARGILRQIGDGEVLARATGIDVVFDFRAADMAAGGHGAPMLPVYHRALAEQAGLARPLAVITIGAVNSVTFIGEDGALVAVDVGPTPNAEAIAGSIDTLPVRPRMWLLAGRGAAQYGARRCPSRHGRRARLSRRGDGLVRRSSRGGSLRLSCRPLDAAAAAELSRHHRRQAADDWRPLG